MADIFSAEKRSQVMSHIRNKDTRPEIKVRKYLFSQGFRYRKNVKTLPGKPDIVLPKYRTVVFVHGCFWHQHNGCKTVHMPETRQEYWIPKLERNMRNDQIHQDELEKCGWRVFTVWECEIRKDFEGTMSRLVEQIKMEDSCNVNL